VKIRNVALVTNNENSFFKTHFSDFLKNDKNLFLIEFHFPHDYDSNLRKLLKVLKANPIDIVFFQMGVFGLKLNQLKYITCKSVCFITDDDWMFDIRTKYVTSYFTYVITTYKYNLKRYKELGLTNIILSQWACNEKVFHPLNMEKKYDVSLIGGPHGDRIDMLNYLIDKGIDIKIYGAGWDKVPRLKNNWGGYLSIDKLVKVINQSKINLNPSMRSTLSGLQLKGRTFEIAGCRAFQLTEDNPYLYDYYDKDKEIITFKDYDDLFEKIQYFLDEEEKRENIIEMAYKRTVSSHTWANRLNEIFDVIEEKDDNRIVLPYVSKSSIDLVYLAQEATTLNSHTVYSINSQVLDQITVYLVFNHDVNEKIDCEIKVFKSIEEALINMESEYCAFIQDGDTWEPEKLKLQLRSLEIDNTNDAQISMVNIGLYINDPWEEDVKYSYRDVKSSFNNQFLSYLLITPSSILVDSKVVQYDLDNFILFLKTGTMDFEFQKILFKKNNYISFVDFDFSLARCQFGNIKSGKFIKRVRTSSMKLRGFRLSKSGIMLFINLLRCAQFKDILVLLYAIIFKDNALNYWIYKRI
jgi:spore maturation protein CgeB